MLLKGEIDEDVPNRHVARLGDLRILGEISLLTSQDRDRDLRTRTTCHLLEISKNSLKKLAKKDISVLYKLAVPILKIGEFHFYQVFLILNFFFDLFKKE